ncbi:MAG: GNAT family N-acetyltransferase [Burkholderiaceae bacterium]
MLERISRRWHSGLQPAKLAGPGLANAYVSEQAPGFATNACLREMDAKEASRSSLADGTAPVQSRAGSAWAQDLAAAERLKDAWRTLETSAFGPIEHFEWTHACAKEAGQFGRLRIVSVWEGGRCRAIAPLVWSVRRWLRLESIGVHQLTEPMDFVYQDRKAAGDLCKILAEQRLPINLPRVPASSLIPEEIRRAFKGRAFVHVSRSSPYPTMRIDASWKDPSTHFNSGRRSDFRRALRAAEQHGEVRLEVISPKPSELPDLLEQALQAELLSWKGRNNTALLTDPFRLAIYRHYFESICAKGMLRLALMRINGQVIGMQIIVETNERLWLLKIGHNEEFSKCSPGTLLMLHLAQYAAQQGLRSIEFLGSAEPWTQLWTEQLQECVQVRVYPPSLASLVSLGFDTFCSFRTRVNRSLARVGR